MGCDSGSSKGVLTLRVALRYPQLVEPDQVRRIRRALGLTQSQFAGLLGVHLVTVKKWETGKQGMRAPADRLIRLLAAARSKAVTKRSTTAKKRGQARKRGGR